MDQITEFKVKATSTYLQVAYVMNRQAAYYGRTADIDSLLATITEVVRSIYRDRANETFTDSMVAEMLDYTSQIPLNYLNTYGSGYNPAGESDSSIAGVSIDYQQSVAAALRNLDKAQNVRSPIKTIPEVDEECENDNVAELAAPTTRNANTTRTSIPRYRPSTSNMPEEEVIVSPPVCPAKGKHRRRTSRPLSLRNSLSTTHNFDDSKCICRKNAAIRKENARKAEAARQAKAVQLAAAAQEAAAAQQAEAATQAAAAEITIAAAQAMSITVMTGEASRLPRPTVAAEKPSGPSKQTQAISQGTKLPMLNQIAAARPPSPCAPGPAIARTIQGGAASKVPVASVQKPARPPSPTGAPRSRMCQPKAKARPKTSPAPRTPPPPC